MSDGGKNELWQFFAPEAEKYDQISNIIPSYQVSAQAMAETMSNQFVGKQLGAWLDLGTGTGNSLISILEHGFETGLAVGLDKSGSWLKKAKTKVENFDPQPALVAGDGLKLPFDRDSFAVLTAVQSMHWLMLSDKPEAVFKEIHRVLNPGGLLLFDESAYHLKLNSKVSYPTTIVQVDGQKRNTQFTGQDLKDRWYFEAVGNQILKQLDSSKTIDQIYKKKKGFRAFKPHKLTEELKQAGFTVEIQAVLALHSRNQMRAAFIYNKDDLFENPSRERENHLGGALARLTDAKIQNQGEVLLQWAATKT